MMATKSSKKIKPALIDDENPEWTKDDVKRARPAGVVLREIFPPEVAEAMVAPKKGRPAGSGKKTAANS
ncbi:MAG: hypothetical protein ACOY8P_12625 [Thermodesulfobacteriota bacterium]|jgi:hypothetical protein